MRRSGKSRRRCGRVPAQTWASPGADVGGVQRDRSVEPNSRAAVRAAASLRVCRLYRIRVDMLISIHLPIYLSIDRSIYPDICIKTSQGGYPLRHAIPRAAASRRGVISRAARSPLGAVCFKGTGRDGGRRSPSLHWRLWTRPRAKRSQGTLRTQTRAAKLGHFESHSGFCDEPQQCLLRV